MNDTEQLFLMAVIWALIAAVVARFIPNWPGRIAFFTIAVAIPFWELPYGYYNFQRLCDEETKLRVFEKIPPQDSVCIAYFDLGLYTLLNQAGFRRIEVTGRSDNANDRVFLTSREQARSSYCISFKSNIGLDWRMWRGDTSIHRAGDDRLIAMQSRFRWDGMWWQQQARPVMGIGGVCSGDLNAPILALRRGSG
jgi:hypothetical protein